MPNRASDRQASGPDNPRAPGSLASSGSRTSSRLNSEVTDARSDSLCVISRALKPGVDVGTANPTMPSSARAHTTATSATEALVIHIFEPLSTQSEPSRRAVVRMPPGLEPKSGSVSPKHPISSPGGHPRQPLLALLLAAPVVDREHRQRPLHRDQAAQPAVDGLQLLAHQAVGRGRRAAAAVAGEVHAEQPELADLDGELADGHFTGFEPLCDKGAQSLFAELPNHGAQLDVLGVQQRIEVEEVLDRRGWGHDLVSTPTGTGHGAVRQRYPDRRE